MVNIEQRNGESYADFMLRLRDEHERELALIDDYIYRLTCMILDEVPICKKLDGALPVFIDRKRWAEKGLREVEDVISSLGITEEGDI